MVSAKKNNELRGETLLITSMPSIAESVVVRRKNASGTVIALSRADPVSNPLLQEVEMSQPRIVGTRTT
jgi:hypothetical protein